MKKKYLIVLGILLCLNLPVFAKVLTGSVELEWPLLNQEERTEIIHDLHEKLFQNVTYKIDNKQFNDHKKDRSYKENRAFIKSKIFETRDRKLAAFYFMGKILIIYGVQYKNDKYRTYYYDALGKLRYVDILEKPFDEFPHISYQYNNKGKLKGVIYNISEHDQYVFKPNGKFYGRWFDSRLYDEKAKIIMTRKISR